MSTRVAGYEGEGRARRRIVIDEGGASPVASDPMAMYGRLSVPGLTPTGGAGPVERRLITEAEREVRAAARLGQPSPIAPRPHLVAPSPSLAQEEPAVVEAVASLVSETETPNTRLRALADAAMSAATAWTAREIAVAAWRTAHADLEAAIAAVAGPVAPAVVESPVNHSDPIPEPVPIRPTAEGGRATHDELQASRKRGQAGMQAARRLAAELTTAAAAKAETKPAIGEGPVAMPAWMRRILDVLIETGGDRESAASKLGYKPTSLVGSLGSIRKRTDLTELERAAITSRRA